MDISKNQWRSTGGWSWPMVSTDPISEVGSVMGVLCYCYGPYYEMGVAHTVGLSHPRIKIDHSANIPLGH